LAEVEEAAGLGVDQILLDNMEPESIRAAVDTIRRIESRRSLRRTWIEVSGGVTLATIRARALPGVDLISVGALTHSARALDLSLELELSRPAGAPGADEA
jgi:nicotinate-nucleotide pyrophosphorylase (carboxylating)